MAYDVVVVGNGPFGLSLGVALARRGSRVAVVGTPWTPPAAALLETFGDVTPRLLDSEHGRIRLDWTVQAAKLWPDWLAGLEADVLTADGTLVVLNTMGLPEVDTANFGAIRTALEQYDEPFEAVDPDEFEWLDPEPVARPLRALYLPTEHAVDATGLQAGLVRAFQAAGGELVAEGVVRLVRAGRVDGVVLESGTVLNAAAVVLADDVHAAALLPGEAETPRIVSSSVVSALVDTDDGTIPPYVVRTPQRAFAAATYAVPHRSGQVQLGATEVVAGSAPDAPPVADVMHVLNAAARQIRRDLGEGSISTLQLAGQPVAVDGMPLVGETAVEGLWLLTGPNLTLAPLLAEELATAVLGGEPALDLTPFQPTRSPIDALTRSGIVAATVTHLLAGGYETNWIAPVEWPALLEATVVTELHRRPPAITGELEVRLR
ncbi:NAD(P)/FAD-dependent oxidoreductase [Kribbella antibiotica]|nr:FAD-binding oxidoreductase [Kribbella antibiotica]